MESGSISKIAAFEAYLRERVAAYPELTASRLHRELRDLGFTGGYTMVKVFLRTIRPGAPAGFKVRFETAPGRQTQVDFAHFRTVFTDEPGIERVVWLSPWCWATAACCGAGSCHSRTYRRCCAATPPRSKPWVARQPRSSTTA